MASFENHLFLEFGLYDNKAFAFDVMMDDPPVLHSYDDHDINFMNMSVKEEENIQLKKQDESEEKCFLGEDHKSTEAKKRNSNVKEAKNGSGEKAKVTVRNAKKDDENSDKGYIHVRARRGQATDSHSLAERVRREKISERMKTLQTLVPGCDKVTGKALMLDEIINYVQSLQNQVEFLSMKLASMNPVLCDFSNGSGSCYETKPQNVSALQPAVQSERFLGAVDSTAFHISNDLSDISLFNASDYSLLLHPQSQNTLPQFFSRDDIL